MEYARRRSRRRRRRGSDTGTSGRAVVALLMVAAIVYLIAASSAGEWIAQKVIAPVIEAFSSGKADEPDKTGDSTDVTEPPEDASEVSLSSEKNSVSVEVALPSVTSYMLQMGAFSTEENAKAQAALLRTMGGGGYVLNDGERYRVLAGGYTTQEDADGVRARLKAEGVDCVVYTIATPAVSFRVTAPESQMESVKSGFEALSAAQSALSSTAMMFDATTGDIAEGKAACANIAAALDDGMEVLLGYSNSDSAILTELLNCYETYQTELATLAGSQSQTLIAFSAEIKYTQMYLTHEYSLLTAAFGAQA